MPDVYYKHPVTGKMVPEKEIPGNLLESIKRKDLARRKKLDDSFAAYFYNMSNDIIDTYKEQKSKVDRLNVIIKLRTYLASLVTEVERIDPDVLETNKMPGTSYVNVYGPDEQEIDKELTNIFFQNEYDKDNLPELRKFYEALAIFQARLYIETGNNYKYIYDNKTVAGEHDRELKARYMTFKGGFGAGYEYNEYTNLSFDGYGDYLTGEGTSNIIWTMVDFSKDKTKISDLLNIAGATRKQRDKFLEKYMTTEDANAFDTFAEYYLRTYSKQNSIYDNPEYANPATRQAFLAKNPKSVKIHEELVRQRETEEKDIIGEMMSGFGQLVRNAWLLNIHENVKKNLSEEDAKLFDIGKDICMGNDIHLGDKFSKEEIKDLDSTATELLSENVVKANRDIHKAVTSKKSLKIRTIPGISETFNDEAMPLFNVEDEMALSRYIAILDATGNGSGMFHQSNSEGYERMLSSIKAYQKAIAEKSGGRALEYKEEMVDNLKAYIKGKKSLRHSDFGKTRFDVALGLLSRFLDKDEYKVIINRVNEVRGATEKTPSKGYVTIDKYEAAYKDAAKEVEAERIILYEESESNVLKLNTAGKNMIEERLDGVYGEIPKCSAIGYAPENAGLSEKDFAAIAYVAHKTITDAEEEAYYDRKKALSVMEDYGNGDKKPLAGLLVKGIRYLSDKLCEGKEIDSDFLLHGELLCRISRMIERDAELKKYAKLSGLKKNDAELVSAVKNLSEVKFDADKAPRQIQKLKKADENIFNKPEAMAKRDRQLYAAVTDVVTKKMIELTLSKSLGDEADKGSALKTLMYFSNKSDLRKFKEDTGKMVARAINKRYPNDGTGIAEQNISIAAIMHDITSELASANQGVKNVHNNSAGNNTLSQQKKPGLS